MFVEDDFELNFSFRIILHDDVVYNNLMQRQCKFVAYKFVSLFQLVFKQL